MNKQKFFYFKRLQFNNLSYLDLKKHFNVIIIGGFNRIDSANTQREKVGCVSV